MRRTIYYPEKIERYFYSSGWQPYNTPTQKWQVPWVDKSGAPLGIAAIHFYNPSCRAEAWDAIGLQDGANKSLIDTLAAADQSAFRILFAAGWMPTTDGKDLKADKSNQLEISPGAIIGTTKADGKLEAIDPADLGQLMDLTQRQIMWSAMTTSTPLSRFLSSKETPAADTLKEQSEPLQAKVELRQALFGNSWEDALKLARRLNNTFGTEQLDESVSFSTNWYVKASLDDLKKKRELGVPQEQIWAELGYSPEQIATMKNSIEYQARVAGFSLAAANVTETEENSGT